MTRRGILRISWPLLCDYLTIPKTTQLVRVNEMPYEDVIEVVVASPDLPEALPGDQLPLLNPVLTRTFDWGIDES